MREANSLSFHTIFTRHSTKNHRHLERDSCAQDRLFPMKVASFVVRAAFLSLAGTAACSAGSPTSATRADSAPSRLSVVPADPLGCTNGGPGPSGLCLAELSCSAPEAHAAETRPCAESKGRAYWNGTTCVETGPEDPQDHCAYARLGFATRLFTNLEACTRTMAMVCPSTRESGTPEPGAQVVR